jgi:hypothetical protein
MTLWELLQRGAALAEKAEATKQSMQDSIDGVKAIKETAEITAGRGILTARFVGRGRQMVEELEHEAESGKPPGTLRTARAVYDFLRGDDDPEV